MRLFVCIVAIWFLTRFFPGVDVPVLTIVGVIIAMILAGAQDIRELER